MRGNEQELGRLLRRAARATNRIYRERVAALDLTPRQAAAILALSETPGATLSGLAESLGADQATTSALVDRLLSAGLVLRETDPADRRRAMLRPTDAALSLIRGLGEARRYSEACIMEVLGAGDCDTMAAILSRLIDGLGSRESAATEARRA
jgi:DNA-binding MarR family transcriptional regulator